MSATLSVSSPRNTCSPLSWCSDHKKELLLTSIAIIAITAIVIGILAILARSYTGLSDLKAIGVPGGASLVAIGGIVLMLTLAIAYYAKNSLLTSVTTVGNISTHTSTVNGQEVARHFVGKVEIAGFLPLQDPEQLPPYAAEIFNKILVDFGIENLPQHLDQLYGEKIKRVPKLIIPLENNASQLNIFQNQLKISLIDNVLAIPLQNVNKWTEEEIDFIHCRMSILESHPTLEQPFPSAAWEDYDPTTMTLKDFREIAGQALFNSSFELDMKMFGLLRPEQIEQLLACPQTWIKTLSLNEFIMLSLPIATENSRQHTQKNIRVLSVPTFAPHIDHFSVQHLRLLSDEQFKSQMFPWKELMKFPQKVEELFSLYFLDRREALRILRLLGDEAIEALLSVLTGKHLRLLSDEQFKSQTFPWKELVKFPQKVEELFSLHYYNADDARIVLNETGRILRLLGDETIEILKPFLTETHVRLLRD